MVGVRELTRPIRPVALRDEGSSTITLEELALRSVPELARQMERHQVEIKGQLQKLEDLIVRSGSLLADSSGGLRKLGNSGGNDALGGGGCEAEDDKGSSFPAFTGTDAGDNDLSATSETSGNAAASKAREDACHTASPEGDDEFDLPIHKDARTTIHQSTMLTPGSHRFSTLIVGAIRYEDNCCAKLVGDSRFDHACAVLIIASSLMVGVEVQYKTDENAFALDVFGYIFVGLFTLELLVRMRARGLRRYFNGLDYGWSVFDMFCVCSSYLELIVSTVQQGGSGGSFLLVVRTLRVVRIARIIRVIRFLGKLRMMVYTMLGAMRMLGWAVLLLGMIMYMFSVCFTEAVKPLLPGTQQVNSETPELISSTGQEFFGDLYVSMLTLMESITGGVSWYEPLRVLREVSALYVFMFLFYICVTVLTLLNVITGLCCDYAIQNAVTDRADVIKQQLGLKDRWKAQFATMFKAIDEDGSGEVTSEELRNQLQEEEFQAYLAHLNISVDDAMELLEVLDSDHDGTISLEEFVTGCMRVKGQAKTIDLMKIMRECTLTRMTMNQKFNEIDHKLTLQMRHL
eukprot:TRINITY_DN25393_c0_g1_i1.p1 TRINITY_DN25393_c0_g1~~TRINITY_DN25393_c0_g1_i1.p1  ORF type:complete len:573 (-),score=109.14 TRINITY_DN25393_c0_g1_i1:97-1815(-)